MLTPVKKLEKYFKYNLCKFNNIKIMKNCFLLFFLLLLSCQSDSFDFDKLSTNTGLQPELQFPVGKIDLKLENFLDDLNFTIDYDRDPYATIYLKDTLDNLARVGLNDIFDITTLSTDFESSYRIEPIELADLQTSIGPIFVSERAQLPDNQFFFIPEFPAPLIYVDSFRLFEESFSSVAFESGELKFDMTNKTPIFLNLDIALIDSNGVPIITLNPIGVPSGSSHVQTIDLEGLSLSQNVALMVKIDSPGSGNSLALINHANDVVAFDLFLKEARVSEATLSTNQTFDYNFSKKVSFNNEDQVTIRQLNLERVRLNLEVENHIGFATNINLKSPASYIEGIPLQKSFSISSSYAPQNFNWEPNDMELNFSNPASGVNELLLEFDLVISLRAGQVIKTNRNIFLKGSFENLQLDTAFGNFGVLEDISTEIISLEGDFDLFSGDLSIVAPKIDLIIHNSFGIPSKITPDITAKRKDLSALDFIVDSSIKSRIIGAPTEVFDTLTTRFTYDNTNSNIADLLSFRPDSGIETTIQFSTNPPSFTANENFITRDSESWLDAEIEIPAHFNVDNFVVQDTLFLSSPLLEDESLKKIIEAKMFINYSSYVPLDLLLEVEVLDTQTNTVLVTLPNTILEPAPTNDNGEVTGQHQGILTLIFENEQITALQKGDGIVFNVTTSSTEKETKNIKVSANSSMAFDVSVAVKIDLDE
jgi:hypothetical protein